jgi:hypothetical protein
MRVQVVSDHQGRIISLSKLEDIGHQPSGIGGAGIVAQPGQHVHFLDLPKELQLRSLLDIHGEFRVHVQGDKVHLVSAKEFRGPFQPK